jgi:hypothetical protein
MGAHSSRLTPTNALSNICLTLYVLEQIKITVEKIKDYYKNKNIQNAAIDIYWYGGEPTTMGVKMFSLQYKLGIIVSINLPVSIIFHAFVGLAS